MTFRSPAQLLSNKPGELQVDLSDFNAAKCGVPAVYSYPEFPRSLFNMK